MHLFPFFSPALQPGRYVELAPGSRSNHFRSWVSQFLAEAGFVRIICGMNESVFAVPLFRSQTHSPLEAFAWFLVVRVDTPEERMCDDWDLLAFRPAFMSSTRGRSLTDCEERAGRPSSVGWLLPALEAAGTARLLAGGCSSVC
jgi:hypothetical protein